ncbi:MAG: photosynthetic complex assembly protein PuhC [Sphingomonadaceae bacterium]
MSGHAERPFPREALWAAGGLIALAVGGAAAVRAGLLPQVADPQAMRAEAAIAPLASRDLFFRDRADGAVVVMDGRGAIVSIVEPMSEQGFVRGVMRGLARERRLKGVEADVPFRLQLWADNGLTLTDLATGRQIELGSFGAANRAAFAVMLPPAGSASQ